MAVDYVKEGRIAIMTINRPEARNALNADAHRELAEAMFDFRDNSDLWVAIITGAGDISFSAGQDLKAMGGGQQRRPEGERPERPATPASAYNIADKIYKPFIAAINGYALGGGLELALTCDIRIAAEHASFGQPEVLRGFIPGGGGTQRLPRFIPRAKAAELLLMGQRISAEEALAIGLVNKVVPLDQLMSTAREWAEIICQAAPLGVWAAKEAMIRGYEVTLEEGLKIEREMSARCTASEDFREGVMAFAQKRTPEWKAK